MVWVVPELLSPFLLGFFVCCYACFCDVSVLFSSPNLYTFVLSLDKFPSILEVSYSNTITHDVETI